MQVLIRSLFVSVLFLGVLGGLPANALAQETTEDRLQALEERLRLQEDEIQRLRSELDAQGEAMDTVGQEVDAYLSKVEDTSEWQKPGTFRVYWKNGLNMGTSDGAFKLKIGGRIQSDWSWLDANDDLQEMFDDKLTGKTLRTHEFRRARLFVSGTIYDRVEFKAQYDFAGGDADFKDVWVGLKKLPIVGNFRVGHHKVLMGLETLTSAKYITFMERAGTTALLPEREAGFFLFNTELDQRLYWGAAYYTPATDGYGNGVINNGLSARVAGTPWYDKSDGQVNLLHLGFSVAFEDAGKDEEFSVSNRPPNHTSPIKPISITVEAESRTILQAELAAVYGPFSFQTEYVQQQYKSKASGDPKFNAYYLYGSWFITGEQRPYKQKYAIFDRVKPLHNFLDGDGGMGAWELAVRYSAIDADDGRFHGGEMDTFTVGLNWHLNPNVRISFNYYSSNIKQTRDILDEELGFLNYTVSDKGKMSGFMMRFQVDF